VCKAPERVKNLKEALQALTLRFRWKRGGAGWHSEFNLQVGKLKGQYQTEKELTSAEQNHVIRSWMMKLRNSDGSPNDMVGAKKIHSSR
jgi:hypothetical protein